MFQILRKIFTKKHKNLTPVQVSRIATDQHNPFHEPGIFNLPPSIVPIDSVIDVVNIPGENGLQIMNISRVVESREGERIQMNEFRPSPSGCGHPISSLDEYGGICDFCFSKALEGFHQGGITRKQLEDLSKFCSFCASFCMNCFTQRLCANHTKLVPDEVGRKVPVCPTCYEALTHEGGLTKLLRILFG